jgi:HSP20 family protein
MSEFSSGWMWSEACEMLARAERLHRELFRPAPGGRVPGRIPTWEPPVDVLETEREVLVLVALPGVDPDQIETVIEGAHLVVTGQRLLPAELATAVIHRLELPQGRFERRIRLPGGRYEAVHRAAVHGCVLITLQKMGMFRG